MAIDLDTPEGKWFDRLTRELHDRRSGRAGNRRWSRTALNPTVQRPPLQVLDDYRRGDPPLRSDIHSGWKPYVRQFVRMGRLNLADLAITSTTNRIRLRDFRTSAANDELGDEQARQIMRANDLKALSKEVHETFLTMGHAYTIVTPPLTAGGSAIITAEDPRQVITAHDPTTGQMLAALKMFRSDWDDEDLAYLYLPGQVFRLRHAGRSIITNGPLRIDEEGWALDDDVQTVPNGQIPVSRFKNRDGVGEFEYHLDTLDRINDKIFDEWWIAKIQAFRQRAVKNLPDSEEVRNKDTGMLETVEVPDDAYDDMFTSSPDEMWQVPGDVEFWESAPVDLTPITNAVDKDRQRLAASLSLSLTTFAPDAANQSAGGSNNLRDEHLSKIEDRRDRTEAPWARTMSQAFLFQGDSARADVTQIEPLWGPIERFSITDMAEAASKAGTSLPREAIQRDIWQYAPAEIPNLRTMAGRDLLFQPPTTGGTSGAGGSTAG